MKAYVIEIPSTADFIEITDVWEASVRATHDFLKEEDIQFFRPLILNEYLKAVDLYCIRIETRIAGFIGLGEGSVEMLFIHPDFHGCGIGSHLLQFAIEERHAVTVDVNEQNLQAVTFYQKMGFVMIGRSETDGMGKPFPLLHMKLA